MNCINILLIILIIFIILSLISIDHFKPINSLKIKYNANNVIVPNKLAKKPTLSIKEKIISELNSSPLSFENQIYSMAVYPHIGEKQICLNDNDCSTLTSRCNKDVFNRNSGIGICTIKTPDKTVFEISY